MPARKKNDQAALPGMPTMADLRDTLWKAADKLRGSMDAAQYKDFVLGLVFLKYVSDAFDERREQIRAEVLGRRRRRGPAGPVPRRRRRVHRPRRLLGAAPRRAGSSWPSTPRAAGHRRKLDRRRDGAS